MSVKIGCQTYTWQMSGGLYDNRLDHIIHIAANAGFEGIEPETRFLGQLANPQRLQLALDVYKLELPALTLVEDWLYPKETVEERKRADYCIEILKHFPNTLLNLCQMPGRDRLHLTERQQNCLSCINAIADRAAQLGIRVGFHPNSPQGSVFRTQEDYALLIDGLNHRCVGLIADTGHIAKAGMSALDVIKHYFPVINHIHYKDMYSDGRWAALGEGIIDDQLITQYLVENDYGGWIVVEDECDAAITDPDSVTIADGQYVMDNLLPIISEKTTKNNKTG